MSAIFNKGDVITNNYFTGTAYLKMLVPGGQILLVTSGEGYYQEEGKPAQKLHAGDVVTIPANLKHWHGATKNSEFVHLAITTNP
ncbi:cupin domain-containing protein [Listeria newyorkensis]|uniref:Cupin domain-containing protein n=1 Tax=Listeria newyorkensis TaxID=1497681 RepID=A0A841YT70_9LIST|nr:cupin domain-containing protein [Listeria newyorkensis]MBC1456465.1 cupin domain-containing protein [Listeria newyorkensis]